MVELLRRMTKRLMSKSEVEFHGFTARLRSRLSNVVVLCAPGGEPVYITGVRDGAVVTYLVTPEQRVRLQMQGDIFLNLLIREAYGLSGKAIETRVLFPAQASEAVA